MTLERKERGYELASQTLQELETAIGRAWEIAKEFGLDPFSTHFELVPAAIMYEFGAYGLPGRFSHWTHGKAYHQLKTMYDYGLSKIYELVINTNPSQAFLLSGNTNLQNILVAAHVLGHTDFFKNNIGFAATDRRMAETASLHAQRVRNYELKHGTKEVEEFLDAVLSIQLNIDSVDLERPTGEEYKTRSRENFLKEQEAKRRRVISPYEDLMSKEERKKPEKTDTKVPFPTEEEQDLLWFIGEFSPKPLEDWQKDTIAIVRSEMQYFLPQMKTKIMNEGWATFWHARIMREMGERGYLTPGEDIKWMEMHAGVAMPHYLRVNPYWLGWRIWEDIHRKFQGLPHPKGKKERNWRAEEVKPESLKGRDEYDIFLVRANTTNDQEFLRNYLTPTLIEDLELYVYGVQNGDLVVEQKDPEIIRGTLINALTNFGEPVIRVAVGGGDYKGNQELYLKHAWEGQDLDINWAKRTLRAIYKLWGRPVHLETIFEGEPTLITCTDGEATEEKKFKAATSS